MTDKTKTRSERVAADVSAALRARHPLIWIVTREEARTEQHLCAAAVNAGYTPRFWDIAQGITDLSSNPPAINTQDIGSALAFIESRAKPNLDRKPERNAFILRDAPVWIGDGIACAQPQRMVRNLCRTLPTTDRERAQSMIVVTPRADVPPELAAHATVINWPMPDRAEIAELLDAAVAALPENMQADAASPETRAAAIDAAIGLTGEEAQACFAKSLVLSRRIDPAAVAQEKKRIVQQIKGLEWFDPLPGGLDAVGGLDSLKSYLLSRAVAFTPEARAYGLPAPVGAFFAGPSGTGKSLTAKAVGTAWTVPVIRIDLGAAKSKFVGDSEQNLRAAFDVVAAIGRCVVWFDEIEKAMAGATDGGADGGVSSDALGFLLTWLQERRGDAFVIATSNDPSKLPPELIARFDTTWLVDLPNVTERAEIVLATLKAGGRDMGLEQLMPVARMTEGFSGRELAALVPDALYLAYGDGARPITAADLETVARTRRPVSKTSPQQVEKLKAWAANTDPRRATTQATTETRTGGARKVDLD